MTDKPQPPINIPQQEAQAAKEGYVHKDLVAIDQAANVITGGEPDETISSRVRRISDAHKHWSWNPGVWIAKSLNAILNLIQPDHGQKAQAGDLERAQRVVKTEDKALGR